LVGREERTPHIVRIERCPKRLCRNEREKKNKQENKLKNRKVDRPASKHRLAVKI
jgi:hypothetical protein